MLGGTLNIRQIRTHWDEILRLAASIKQGTVTASLMLRKLGSYPRQNGLAIALRELGRIVGLVAKCGIAPPRPSRVEQGGITQCFGTGGVL